MKGYRFYAELPSNRKSKSASKGQPAFTRATLKQMAEAGEHCNCLAVLDGSLFHASGGYLAVEVVTSVQDLPNCGVCTSSASVDYLRTNCVRIGEQLARKLHPALFASNLIGE